jgi:hypothetical protein
VGGSIGAWVGVGRVRRSGGGCGKAGDVVVLVGLERVCVCVCVCGCLCLCLSVYGLVCVYVWL